MSDMQYLHNGMTRYIKAVDHTVIVKAPTELPCRRIENVTTGKRKKQK